MLLGILLINSTLLFVVTTTDKCPTRSKRGWDENSSIREGPFFLATYRESLLVAPGIFFLRFLGCTGRRRVSWREEGNPGMLERSLSPENDYEFQT